MLGKFCWPEDPSNTVFACTIYCVSLKLPEGSFTFQTGFVPLAVIVMELIITFL